MRRLLLLAVLLTPLAAGALEKVALQLKWEHPFQFAGYYAGLSKALLASVAASSETVTRTVTRDELIDLGYVDEWGNAVQAWGTVTETVTETVISSASEFQREGESLAAAFVLA